MPNIYEHAKYINELNHKISKLLPVPVNTHCQLANIKHGSATFLADSSAWAARLRFSIPDILKIFHQQLDLQQVKSIRIKVSIPENVPRRTPLIKPKLSEQSSNLLKNFAESISYPALRASLYKLSRRKNAK